MLAQDIAQAHHNVDARAINVAPVEHLDRVRAKGVEEQRQPVVLEDGRAAAQHHRMDALAQNGSAALLVHEVVHVEPGVEVLGDQHAHVLPTARRVVEKVRLGHGSVANDVLHAHRAQELMPVGSVLEELLVPAHLVGELPTRDVAGKRAVDQRVIDGRELALEERVRAGVAEQPAVHPEALVKLEDLGADLGLGGTAAAHVGNLGELHGTRGTALPKPTEPAALGAWGGGAPGLLGRRRGRGSFGRCGRGLGRRRGIGLRSRGRRRGLAGVCGLLLGCGVLRYLSDRGQALRRDARLSRLLALPCGCRLPPVAAWLSPLGCRCDIGPRSLGGGPRLDRSGGIRHGLGLRHGRGNGRRAGLLGLLGIRDPSLLGNVNSTLYLRRNAERVDAILPLHGIERLGVHGSDERHLGVLTVLPHNPRDVLVRHHVAPHAHESARHGRGLVLLRRLENLAEGFPQVIKVHTFDVGQLSCHAGFLSRGHARRIRQHARCRSYTHSSLG